VLSKLEKIAEVNAREFTEKLFASGSLLTLKPAPQAVTTDCKEYREDGATFSVAQIEEIGFDQFAKRKDELLAALTEYQRHHNYLFSALMAPVLMLFTSLSVTGGLFTLGLARFMFPNVLAEPPSRFKVGFKEGFPAGKVETKYVAQYGVWVVNGEFLGQQQIYALKTVCTHLGCTPNWLEAEQKFKCPCHGSGFYKDGVNFEGPAPRPLERYAIKLADDGQLEVDKSRTFHEELGQWLEPDSYITA